MNDNLILIVLLLVLNKNREEKFYELSSSRDENTLKDGLESSLNRETVKLNIPYTIEKIRVMRKVGPYFDEKYIPAINKSLAITEKVIKLYEVIDFMQNPDINYIENLTPIENNKERLSYIANTIQQEISKEEITNVGPTMELILNVDRLIKMLNILGSAMSNPDDLNDPAKLISLFEPFLEGKDAKSKDKIKDMAKMLEIMKTLDTPKKSDNETPISEE